MLIEFRERLARDTQALEAAGLLKREQIIGSAQGAVVKLADGREVCGFLCEGHAIARGAEDISHLGGWRSYLAKRA